ncbi:MAG: hypothetical protein ACYS47_00405 [Planctomycetota bacterium]|jgi:hypothetical protein
MVAHLYPQIRACRRKTVHHSLLDEPGDALTRENRVIPFLDWLADPTDPRLPALSSPDHVVAPVDRNEAAPAATEFYEAIIGFKDPSIAHIESPTPGPGTRTQPRSGGPGRLRHQTPKAKADKVARIAMPLRVRSIPFRDEDPEEARRDDADQ